MHKADKYIKPAVKSIKSLSLAPRVKKKLHPEKCQTAYFPCCQLQHRFSAQKL